ncbi:ABC-three component system middle component 2 [Rheinheimera oceanensis]|uniref:ABC-three component system middle component 2 n=1 Tax=Rheinheimera oceanensis TaxID=2817449 RepID=UPI001BFDA2B7|nr:ABC-three component system middle component 2 [Rheinheimera oceanensis]
MKERYQSFNSPIELGTRICLMLTALNSQQSLDDLVLLDYALLYSNEFDGPDNLHPALPNHVAEIAHRREMLPKAIDFLLKRGLIRLAVKPDGHYYESNQSTIEFVSCLQSPYYKKAWIRLNWIHDNKQRIVNTKITELAKSFA